MITENAAICSVFCYEQQIVNNSCRLKAGEVLLFFEYIYLRHKSKNIPVNTKRCLTEDFLIQTRQD